MEDIIKTGNSYIDIPEKKKNGVLLLCSVLLGIAFDLLIYRMDFGVSYPIFVIVFYAMLIICARDNISFRLDMGWLLSIPILLLSATYFIFSNQMFKILNFLVIPVLIIAQTVLITGSNSNAWNTFGFVAELLYSMLVRLFANVFKPFKVIATLVPEKSFFSRDTKGRKVLLGLLISVPLLLVVLPLLASADEVFGKMLSFIPSIFANIRIDEILARIILGMVVAILSFSYIWSLTRTNKSTTQCPKIEMGRFPAKFEQVTVSTVLAVVNIVYIVFVIIQFAYLFAGASFALPKDFTYSEYARRGFFELIAVTIINLTILLVVIGFTGKGENKSITSVRMLNSLLIANTMVMLVSAFIRMSLYEKAYGYTYLRILTHAFMVFLFVLFIITLFRIWNDRAGLVKPYVVTALIAFVIINYMNIDVIIAKNNINRFSSAYKLDAKYLTNLSDDAVPEMVKFANDNPGEASAAVKENLEGRKERLSAPKRWQAFNISELRAKKALEDLKQ